MEHAEVVPYHSTVAANKGGCGCEGRHRTPAKRRALPGGRMVAVTHYEDLTPEETTASHIAARNVLVVSNAERKGGRLYALPTSPY